MNQDTRTYRSAADLGLPDGDAIARDGGPVQIVPRGETLPVYSSQHTEVGPAPMPPMVPSATTQTITKTSARDGAESFKVYVRYVTAAFVVGSVVLSWIGMGEPLISATTLAFMLSAVSIGITVAYMSHRFLSNEGISILERLLVYRYHRHDQKARIRYYRDRGPK